MADHRIMQQEKPLFVYYYLKIKYKQQKSNKGGREFRFSAASKKRESAEALPDCPHVSTRSLRCRGGGCSSPPPACRPCSRRSETEAPCPPRWCGVPCPSSAAGAGYPERPWRRGLRDHTRICRHISPPPPDENMEEKSPSLSMLYWILTPFLWGSFHSIYK